MKSFGLVFIVALMSWSMMGCIKQSQNMLGVGPPGSVARKAPVTRKGRNNPLNRSHGHLSPIKVLYGKASYYHPTLDRNLTANGERYDHQGKISAAHLTLPFCTVVRVVRQDTGHTVIVRINDRGPYGHRDRIIDLSGATADALSMKRIGVAPVAVEILEMGRGCTYHHQHR